MINSSGSLSSLVIPKKSFVFKNSDGDFVIVAKPIARVAELLAKMDVGGGYSYIKFNPNSYNVDVQYPSGGLVNYTVKRDVINDTGGQHIERIYYINNITKTERDIFCLKLSRELITFV